MKHRMMLFTFIIIFFITIVVTGVGNYFYARAIENQSLSHTVEVQQQVQKSLEMQIDSVEKAMTSLANSPDVIAYLKMEDTSSPNRVNVEADIRNLLENYESIYDEVYGILVAGRNMYISNSMYRISRNSLMNEMWYQNAKEMQGKPILMSNPIGRNIVSWKKYSADDVLTIAQSVHDETTGEHLGVILVDMKLEPVKDLIKSITLGKTGFVFIMDENGKVVYSPENKIVYRINPEWFKTEGQGDLVCNIVGDNYRIIYNHSPVTNLITIGVFAYEQTLQPVEQIREYSLLIAVILLGLASIWTAIFAASFTRPIIKLSNLMMQAQTGNLNVKFEEPCKGEVKLLGDSYNSMIDKIQELIQLVYQEQKNKREAEIKILQAQIKPHFLYNTLDTIQWMAKKHEANDIIEVVHALTTLFRVGISRGKELIKLDEELKHIQSYLYIQKIRYEALFEYTISYDEELLSKRILKLTLQPIVENAIYHGIKEMGENGHIDISITKEDEDTILITIEDDGRGISMEQCTELNRILKQSERDTNVAAYGIINVNDRIVLSFGSKYGLHYSPRAIKGTRVEIRHKYID